MKRWLGVGSVARLIRTSMARNARQIDAPVAAEVFSVPQQQFEKYDCRATQKPCDFIDIKNPYQNPVVQRLREKPPREHMSDVFSGTAVQSLRANGPQNVVIFAASYRARES